MNRIRKVQIETIRDCNGLCRICDYRDKKRDKVPRKVTGKVFRTIVKKIAALPNLETVCPYNHGEPLLDPTIFNKIRYVKKKIPHVRIELSTNGTRLHEAFGEFCSLVDDRWVSFHGISKETYESNMGLPWEVARRIRGMVKSRPDKHFVISTGLIGYTREDAEKYWRGYNVKVMTFAPRDRAGNIKSDSVLSFDYPNNPDFDCWRFNKFLVFNTEGILLPCSNDLEERGMYASHKMEVAQIEFLRELYREDNRQGYNTICRKCEDSWTV